MYEKEYLASLSLQENASIYSTVKVLLGYCCTPAIMSLPCAFSIMGLIGGSSFIIFLGICGHLSMLMYVKTREQLPIKLDDTWEIAYLLFGRKSIFIICLVSLTYAWTLCVACYVSVVNTVTFILYYLVDMRETGYENAPGWMQWICQPTNILIVLSVLRAPLIR